MYTSALTSSYPRSVRIPTYSSQMQKTDSTLRQESKTIGLIGLAHGTSHFHHMLLAPLFPFFIQDFGLSYAELGLLVSLFFTISGVGQTLSGFLVDKIGARPVLMMAIACFVGASISAALAHSYLGLALAAALAGLGNAPFHPADFTILNKRISLPRLGHAFSVHGISGNLGWAAAPPVLLGISHWRGDWRDAYWVSAMITASILLLLWWQARAIEDRPLGTTPTHPPPTAQGVSGVNAEHPMAFLRLPAVWLCFSFFFWSTAALCAVQSFATPALAQLHQLPVSATAFVVTGFMLFGAAGMVIGGFLVNRVQRLERTIAMALLASAGIFMISGFAWVPDHAAVLLLATAGFGVGLAGPSRDMLIKKAAPPGATGRVYGTVYSGLDLGFALAAPVFGWLLDHQLTHAVFWGAAMVLVLGVLSAAAVGQGLLNKR